MADRVTPGRPATAPRRGPVAACLLLAAAAAGIATVSARQFAVDSLWSGRSPRSREYQGIRELSGRVDVATFISQPNPRDLQGICDEKRGAESMARDTQQRLLRDLEAAPEGSRNDTDYVLTAHSVAQLHAYAGEMREAAGYLRKADEVLRRRSASQTLSAAPGFLESLAGIAELRRGELENCLDHRNPARCLFPIAGAGRHEVTSGSEAAARAFLDVLEQSPDDLEIRWLLNVAMMTLGRYPDGVPSRFRIDPARLASPEDPGRFLEDSSALGLSRVERAGGAVMDDFTGDGRLDIVVSSVNSCEPVRIYVQGPDGRVAEKADPAGLGRQLGGINLVQADYDNDGRLDLYVMRGGWEFFMRDSLLRGNGDGTFEDVTAAAGVLEAPHRTHSAGWADYDLDGRLDLFVGHEETPSTLFRNRGDGTFENATKGAGLAHRGFVKGVSWGDYDRDGYPDLFLSNFDEPNRLFRNRGDGTFVDVTRDLGVVEPFMSFPAWFFDYDNDGWEDLFVASFVPSVVETVRHYVGEPPRAETSRLYRNAGGGRFDDVTAQAGLGRSLMAMGANFGDIDNDGWLDMYIGTGAPSFAAVVPNVLFRNNGGTGFADVSASTGTGHLQKGHGVAFGDIDLDGDQDLFANMGGFVPADAYANVLFRNPGHGRHWLAIALQGVRTNRAAIGARVTATVTEKGKTRRIHRTVGSGGSFGANPLAVHVGVGAATVVDRLEVYWPVSRTTQVFTEVPVDRTVRIVELATAFATAEP